MRLLNPPGFWAKHPEIDLAKSKLGVFAKLAKPDSVLRDRDRVEIYRPLIADPKEVRKQRVAEGKVMKKALANRRVSSASVGAFLLLAVRLDVLARFC